MEKWERQPFRVGMLLGFVLIPLFGLVEEYLLRKLTGGYSLSRYVVLQYFVPGALYGAVLGAGALQAVAAIRKGDFAEARWHLLWSGGTIALFLLFVSWQSMPLAPVFFYGTPLPSTVRFFLQPAIFKNLPLHCAVLMVLLGLLMRSKR